MGCLSEVASVGWQDNEGSGRARSGKFATAGSWVSVMAEWS